MQKYTLQDLQRDFPDDAACLEWLRNYLYPDGIFCKNCQRVTKHHRVASRPSYSCDVCGHHVHPTAGTIFHKSTTPLRLWFYAIYLMASTRCGISAKQLERELGVTYKTAWRMFHQIRTLLQEDVPPTSGPVEMDETYMGGVRPGKRGRGAAGKTPVAGVVERKGKITVRKVRDAKAQTLMPILQERVLPGAIVYTDELTSYNGVTRRGYEHRRIHHAAKVYVQGDTHTNTIEGFWSLLKRGIGGVFQVFDTLHTSDIQASGISFWHTFGPITQSLARAEVFDTRATREQRLTTEQRLALLDYISHPSEREDKPLSFDPDDYPLY